jgi:hypothetical protein
MSNVSFLSSIQIKNTHSLHLITAVITTIKRFKICFSRKCQVNALNTNSTGHTHEDTGIIDCESGFYFTRDAGKTETGSSVMNRPAVTPTESTGRSSPAIGPHQKTVSSFYNILTKLIKTTHRYLTDILSELFLPETKTLLSEFSKVQLSGEIQVYSL